METTCLRAVIINYDVDSGNARGALPEIGFLPVVRETCWLEEKHVSCQTSLAMSHEFSQFANSRSRAGAVWMNQHD
ncbi:MAG: hypothetical protein QOC96_2211 [Acidobacteriota bacterium]|nr:hypothetical protein [Acidobacteriota bacterium]